MEHMFSALGCGEFVGEPTAKKAVAESQPWSVADWAVAPRSDNPRATVLVLVLG